MNILKIIALILCIIGSVNWGLIGLLNFNLVDTLFGVGSLISIIIYILVGVSGFLLDKVINVPNKFPSL